jgi:hypothetical protein
VGAATQREVTFTTNTAGVLAALNNQRINILNNFENTRSQLVTITLAPGAAAFNAAVGNATPAPVVVANQRVGGSNDAAITITNTAPGGAFTEGLNAAFGTNGGDAANNGGSISLLAGLATNSTAMRASVNTASAGAKSGTVQINYQSDGTGTSGLAAISAGSQLLNVTGNVFRTAVGAATPSPISFANVHVGGVAQQLLTVANTATNDGFSERLNAGFTGSSGSATTSAGNVAGLAAGSSNNSAMGVTLNTTTAGAKSGNVTLGYVSTGAGTSGLADISAGNQVINFSGNVYRLAQPNAIAPVNFGNVLANSVQTRTLTLSNDATADGFSEALNAAFGTIGGTHAASFGASGAIAGLLAGNSNNTAMVVTLDTSATGAKTANVQVLLNSNGGAIGNGLGITALPTQVINLDGLITANVGNLASAGLSPTNVNFGKFREGAANQTQQLTITNLTQGPGEGLNASFGAASGGATNNNGSITALATGANNNTSMSVTLNGMATAGPKTGAQVLNFASDGSFNNNTVTPLPSQNVNLSAEVYRLASAAVNTPINLGARRVGDAAATGTLTIGNTAANDGFSEGLRGNIGAAPAGFSVSGAANTALIAAGANEQRTVSLTTTTAGDFAGSITLGMVSNGAGTSGFGDLALADKLVALAGKVYTAAVGALATSSVDFGVVRVGDVVAARNVTVNNTASTTALNDTLSATLSVAASPFSAGGTASGIAALGSGQVAVGLATAAAGVYNVNANMAFLSQNPDMSDASAGPDAGVNLLATINNLANADFDFLSGLGVLTQNGNDYVLDLGNITQGSSISSLLRLDNDVAGPADVLGGAFDLGGVNDFTLTGWNPVSGLAAGAHVDTLALSYLASTLGPYQDSIVFNGLGTNASDPEGLAQQRRLIIRANVVDPNGQPVPEPGSLALLLAAAVAGLIVRRRRRAG